MESFEPVHNKTLDRYLETLKDTKFEPKFTVNDALNLKIYDIQYYERHLDVIEEIHEGEKRIGNISVKRQYVMSEGD